jgi:hypothetical protein
MFYILSLYTLTGKKAAPSGSTAAMPQGTVFSP